MKYFLPIILLIFITVRCNSKRDTCNEPRLKQLHFSEGCNGDKCGYYHTVMLDNYYERCFDDYDFIYIADKYLDSVKANLPVNGITFVKPFDFQPHYDSRDYGPIRENSIVDIYYNDETMKNKVPEITSISIWTNGERKSLEYMYVSSRQQRMNYYNSKKK